MSTPNKNIALITGASGELGQVICESFAQENFDLILLGKTKHKLKKLELYLSKYKVNIHTQVIDLAKLDRIEKIIQKLFDRFAINLVVNNAGINLNKDFFNITHKNIQEELTVNLIAPVIITQIAAKNMNPKITNSIINIASIKSAEASFDIGYGTSKAGLIQFSYTAAKELASKNIRVNIISPGLLHTRMTNHLPSTKKREYKNKILLNRFGEPKEVAELAVFLASKKSSYINGACINIDGGYKK